MTGVTLHGHVHYKEIQARTCSGPLFSSVKPYSRTMSICVYQRYSTGNAFDVAVICPKVRGMYGFRFSRTLIEFH